MARNVVKKTVLLLIIASLASVSGFMLQRYYAESRMTQASQELVPDPIIGKPRPEFALRDLSGELRSITEWDDKVILLNFWATWCPPCMREIPTFVELQEKYRDHGLQIVSIAIDDVDAIQHFADDMGINYPVLPSELEGIELARQYGNRISGLPFTAFINKNSIISHIKAGELTHNQAESILEELGVKTHL